MALDACRTVAAASVASLPAGSAPVYVEVVGLSCRADSCDAAAVVLELAGAQPIALQVGMNNGRLTGVSVTEALRSRREPASARLAGNVVPLHLGHCGLWSGIDVDGSFWDPVGVVNTAHPDAINSAPGTFALTSPTTATLRTDGGLTLQLVRHQGPKFLPGCD